ncbi:FecCD family ABC transporter permease [Kribbella kalugense]|uniref:Iron complex transport system permease protein n=1 Tax=Kribbella kalugense TaxID=2512221 RepID=A0A4R7ZV30_9ACTN|nr:iron chelate uptake ABC transporter family permease subunit [Kribbella kalugense]TDW21957.1 iron complex transport system permease protein [Kribbella kalugense]
MTAALEVRAAIRSRRQRTGLVCGLLLLIALAVSALALVLGDYHVAPLKVLDILAGGGDQTERFIIVGQRLPRAIAALLVGAALGLAGALFQSISRNPLGSPDVIGFTTGSASGALLALLIGNATGARVAVWAVLGGLLTAVAVLALTGRGQLRGERLIVGGIAVGAMLAAVNDYLITRADPERAQEAKLWLLGSLNGINGSPVRFLAVVLLVLFVLTACLRRRLGVLETGDDLATALGVRPAQVRLLAALLGVALTGAAVAVSGPIGFLALAAPQLGRRLTRSPTPALASATVTGALLLAVADLVSQRALAPFQIPVGLVTGVLGGAYLAWLIGRR